jgi:hypothetical protein
MLHFEVRNVGSITYTKNKEEVTLSAHGSVTSSLSENHSKERGLVSFTAISFSSIL